METQDAKAGCMTCLGSGIATATSITQKGEYCHVFKAQSRVMARAWSQTKLPEEHFTVKKDGGWGTVHSGGSWRKAAPKIQFF